MTDRGDRRAGAAAAAASSGRAPDWLGAAGERQEIGHVKRQRRHSRKLPSFVRRLTTAIAFYLLFLLHLQIIPSSQEELLPAMVASGRQLVLYGRERGNSAATKQQITRRSFNGQLGGTQSADAPKLIPLSALDRYQEGTDLRLFCSASAPKSAGRLYFEWRKNQNELLTGPTSSRLMAADSLDEMGTSKSPSSSMTTARLQISMMDESASVLRISALEANDAGNYTCLVRNQQGSDSSTVRVNVLVKMKWTVEPPAELQVRAGKLVQLECDASGQPAPLISWTSLKDHQTINSKLLRIDRVSTNDSGMYECRATRATMTSGQQQHRDHGSEQLRKIVRLTVNVKVWDINMNSRPVECYHVHEFLRSKLCSLYENEYIFDKFECCFDGSDRYILTGSYNNFFKICDRYTKQDIMLEASKEVAKTNVLKPRKVCPSNKKKKDEISVDSLDFTKKILYSAWHPKENTIAIAATNNLFLFQEKQ